MSPIRVARCFVILSRVLFSPPKNNVYHFYGGDVALISVTLIPKNYLNSLSPTRKGTFVFDIDLPQKIQRSGCEFSPQLS